MKLKLFFFTGVVLSLIPLNGFAQTIKPKISAIRVQLFYEAKGTLSDDLFSQKDLSLWNTIIGEGSSGGASNSTLVTVVVSGKDVQVGSTKVEITARNSKNVILVKKLIHVSLYDERTEFFAPLWLYDTGCEPIKISARLIGKGATPTVVKKTIPFACGE